MGSLSSHLDGWSSDIDVLITPVYKEGDMVELDRLNLIKTSLQDCSRFPGFKVVKFITKTLVPVLTLLHEETKVLLDVTVAEWNSPRLKTLQVQQLIKRYAASTTLVGSLLRLLKYCLKRTPLLSASTQGLSSFGWTNIIIFFLLRRGWCPLFHSITLVQEPRPWYTPSLDQAWEGFMKFLAKDLFTIGPISIKETEVFERRGGDGTKLSISHPLDWGRDIGAYVDGHNGQLLQRAAQAACLEPPSLALQGLIGGLVMPRRKRKNNKSKRATLTRTPVTAC